MLRNGSPEPPRPPTQNRTPGEGEADRVGEASLGVRPFDTRNVSAHDGNSLSPVGSLMPQNRVEPHLKILGKYLACLHIFDFIQILNH